MTAEPLDLDAIEEMLNLAIDQKSTADTIALAVGTIPALIAALRTAQQQLAAERAAREGPRPEKYACGRCGRRDGLDVSLKPADWAALESPHEILCLWCIDDLAAEKGLRIVGRVYYGGRADYEQRGGLLTELYEGDLLAARGEEGGDAR